MSCWAVLFSAALPTHVVVAGDYEDIILVNGFEPSARLEIGEIVIVEIMANSVTVADANGEWLEFVASAWSERCSDLRYEQAVPSGQDVSEPSQAALMSDSKA